MRVLICEDNEISGKILSRFIKPYGEIVVAEDGKKGWDCYLAALEAGKPFDLIFMDVVMPFQNGIGLLAAIREHEAKQAEKSQKPVPVLMVTGQVDFDAINKAKSLGAVDYILKPVEESKLLRELRRLQLIDDSVPQF